MSRPNPEQRHEHEKARDNAEHQSQSHTDSNLNLLGQHKSTPKEHKGGETETASAKSEPKSATKSELAAKTETSIADALKKDPKNIESVFGDLQKLKTADGAEKFKQDLSLINADLHKAGLLPNLEITEDKTNQSGFALKPATGTGDSKSDIADKSQAKAAQSPESIAAQKPAAPGVQSPDAPAVQASDAAKAAAKAPESQPESHSNNVQKGQSDHIGHETHHGHAGHHGPVGHHGHASHHRHGGHHRGGASHRVGHGGKSHSFAGGAYDSVKAPDNETLGSSIKTVLAEAKAQGLSDAATKAAVASMLVESKGNPEARGDHNTSFGLFQLHRGGELTDALQQGKLSNESEAFDPAKNAQVALAYFKKAETSYHDMGKLAAAAQRPLDRVEYAAKVNELIKDGSVDSLISKYST